MELIPILSTIILVATICTFILAIGAYILYKIREGRQQTFYQTKPSTVKAEIVTPAETLVNQQIKTEQRQFRKVEPGISSDNDLQERKPAQSRYTPEPRGYKQTVEKTVKEKTKVAQRLSDENKFLKYTSEGYVSPKEDRDSGAVKWR